MPSIRILQFGGIRPAVEDRLLSLQKATIAHNTELRRGDLRAYSAPSVVRPCPGNALLVAPWMDGDAAEILCANDMSLVPAYRDCTGTDEVLGFPRDGRAPVTFGPADEPGATLLLVPAPTVAPTPVVVSPGTAGEHTGPEARSWTYTWVDDRGVESRPAPMSAPINVNDGSVVDITMQTPPARIVSVRIYRLNSPAASGYDAQDGDIVRATPQLVREVDATAVFRDSFRTMQMWQGALLTADQCDPPTMEQVLSTEAGYLVGFTGRTLLFSEIGEPHNWPMRYRFELPQKIVGLAVWQNSVFIGTTGRPMRYDIAQPEGDGTDMQARPHRYDAWLPLLRRDAITATGNGAAMATRGGVAALDFQGARIVTRGRIDEDVWDASFAPQGMVWSRDRLYAWGAEAGGYILGWGGEDSLDIGDLVTIEWDPIAVHAAEDGLVYYLQGDSVRTWDTGGDPLRYHWRSRIYRAQGWMRWAAAKVVGDHSPANPVTFRLIGDGQTYYERFVTDSAPFRLPPCPRGIEWSIELLGRTTVREAHVATSIQELTEAGGEQ